MAENNYQILLYYKYTPISNPNLLLKVHKKLCESLNLKGRIIIAKEGINGTVEGKIKNTEKYISELIKNRKFKDMHFKKSPGTGDAFPKLSIRSRKEIVSSHLKRTGGKLIPQQKTGKYITADKLHELIHSTKEFYLVDMRNDYETDVGHFNNSILAPFKNFRDLPKIMEKIKTLKDKTIITVCTGGVRCEKASGFLINSGFCDVYQLFGGIVTYMEKYPNEDFLGKLYVFDGRITMGFNTDSPKHKIVGVCDICNEASDIYRDCLNVRCLNKRHFIACGNCFNKQNGLCKICFENMNYRGLNPSVS